MVGGGRGLSNGVNDVGVACEGHSTSQRGGPTNIMGYFSCSTAGDASDFGDLVGNRYYNNTVSNGTDDRGLFCGGYNGLPAIDAITISTPSDAHDYGDMSEGRHEAGTASNGLNHRAVLCAGCVSGSTPTVNIQILNISSIVGAGAHYGTLSVALRRTCGVGNDLSDMAIKFGGDDGGTVSNVMEYLRISTETTATDFGDLSVVKTLPGSISNGINDSGIVCGGATTTSFTPTNTMDHITISTPSNATAFGEMVNIHSIHASASNGAL